MKLPAIQFYPGDWRKDPGVQALDYFTRGVWWEMICLMHESERRGVLLLNGAPMPEEALAKLLGLDNQMLNQTLTKLLTYGVASREEETGAIICRRMIRDEALRKVRKEAGKQGGNPALVNHHSTKSPNQGNPNHNPFRAVGEGEEVIVDSQGRGAGEGGLTVEEAVWVEKIQSAYPDRSCQRDTAPFIIASMRKGIPAESILEGTKEAAELIKKNFPDGIKNRYVAKALSFFRGEKWEAPEVHFAPKVDSPGSNGARPETVHALQARIDAARDRIAKGNRLTYPNPDAAAAWRTERDTLEENVKQWKQQILALPTTKP